MYNVKSNKATEFINDDEILETLKYAEKNKKGTFFCKKFYIFFAAFFCTKKDTLTIL